MLTDLQQLICFQTKQNGPSVKAPGVRAERRELKVGWFMDGFKHETFGWFNKEVYCVFPSGLIFTWFTCLLRSLHIQTPGLFFLNHTVMHSGPSGNQSQEAQCL